MNRVIFLESSGLIPHTAHLLAKPKDRFGGMPSAGTTGRIFSCQLLFAVDALFER